MENRRNIRNWDAFGTIYNFASRMLATELFEPVLKFVFDLSAALLLGVTFIFQILSVFIALDVVLLSFYQVTCSYCCRLFSALMAFITSERERTATVLEAIKYISNIFWVKVIYTVQPDCWTYMRGGPIFAAGLMHTLVGFYTERLTTEQNTKTQVLYGIFLTTLFLIVFNTIYFAPDHILLETVFMLRVPIDTLCNSADTIFKLCDNALGIDNRLPVYTTQIARYSFWSAVHLLQFLLVSTSSPVGPSLKARRADKYIYFFLFMHDLLELTVPVRHLLVQITNERYITKTFPKLTALELSALGEDENCPVCLSEHTRDTVRLRCNHLLHAGCLHSILRQNADTMQPSRCPMCRADIEITPLPARTNNNHATGLGLFGTGMRGLRTRQRGHLYRSMQGAAHATAAAATGVLNIGANGPGGAVAGGGGVGGAAAMIATARGRFGTAEQLIADHLQQHNLQHGDVVHIRIIPRAGRHQAAVTATATIAAQNDEFAANHNANVHLQRNLTTSTQTPVQSHPTRSQIEVDTERAIESIEQAERTSVLREIHRHGLYSESEGSTSTPLFNEVGSVNNSTGASVASQLDTHRGESMEEAAGFNVTSSVNGIGRSVDPSEAASGIAGLDVSPEEFERMVQAAENIVYGNNNSHIDTSCTQIDQDTQETQEMELHVDEAEGEDEGDESESCSSAAEVADKDSSGESSVAERSVGNDDGDDNTVVSTAHSDSDSDAESIDLLNPTDSVPHTQDSATSVADNLIVNSLPINSITHTIQAANSPTSIVNNNTSPAGLKRKYSLVDLTDSPPQSPGRATTARDRVIPMYSDNTQVDGEYVPSLHYTQYVEESPSIQAVKIESGAEAGQDEQDEVSPQRKIQRVSNEDRSSSSFS